MRKPIFNLPPPIIIDIEASGFGADSYPIEVGVIMQDGDRYCRLIKPQPGWQHWDEKAQALHGIERDLLVNKGTSAHQVAMELNSLLAGKTVYSDGWVVDSPWLIKLHHDTQIAMQYRISSLEMILSEAQMQIWHHTRSSLQDNSTLPRHRASTDASIIQHTYMATRNLTVDPTHLIT
ncbi:hypothetical protein [Neptunicella sp. SCSIO 80796]|uniref:hypothetical protein n=1 Tax=Neptunicella plasticusilytica TaxID=3117012 RepID=UPI003A4E1881